MLAQGVAHVLRKPFLVKTAPRQIHRHMRHRNARCAPGVDLLADLIHQPMGKRRNQPGFFGQGDELRWRDWAPFGMAPAGQGLHAVQRQHRVRGDLGLVVQGQLATLQCVVQGPLHGSAFLGASVHLLAEKLQAVAMVAFGLVHRLISMAHQGVYVSAVIGINGNPDAGAGQVDLPLDVYRHGDAAQYTLRRLHRLLRGAVGQQQHEFVARQAANAVLGAHAFAQTLRHHP